MIEIQLSPVPNQAFSINLDNHLYDFVIRETNGCMSVSIARDNIQLLSNSRAVAQFPLIPYAYLELGNFIIDTLNDDLPYYTQFGVSQTLIYLSQGELAVLRAGT